MATSIARSAVSFRSARQWPPDLLLGRRKFHGAIRALGQLDWGYLQRRAPRRRRSAGRLRPGSFERHEFPPRLSRHSGQAFGDWSYNFNFDFGGSGGTETPGHIQSVYLEYDGLAPLAFRVGAFPPPANIEDGTSRRHDFPRTQCALRSATQHCRRRRTRRGVDPLHGRRRFRRGSPTPAARCRTHAGIRRAARAFSAGFPTSSFDDGQSQFARRRQRYLCDQAAGCGSERYRQSVAMTPGATATEHLHSIRSAGTDGRLPTASSLPTPARCRVNHVSQWGWKRRAIIDNSLRPGRLLRFRASTARRSPTRRFTSATTSAPRNRSAEQQQSSAAGTCRHAGFSPANSSGYNAATGAFTPPKPAASLRV